MLLFLSELWQDKKRVIASEVCSGGFSLVINTRQEILLHFQVKWHRKCPVSKSLHLPLLFFL